MYYFNLIIKPSQLRYVMCSSSN